MTRQVEIEREQGVLTRLYDRLDELRDATRARLSDVRRRGASGTPQARSERDAFAALYEDRIAALDAVESGLCFGRLDQSSGESFHIGRIGLSDERHQPMLVDWRAPAAAAFYRATPAEPLGVRRRRQLRTRGRTVLDVEDDVFDVDALDAADRETLGGGGALLAAVSAVRTGRMRDIVATIQAEQDRVIRDDPAGTLVVQGGPGTGKTAVALHRAAYLLYSDRERLSRSGVLVIGPGSTFLRYIEQVLPALGETGVVTATLAGLLAAAPPGTGRGAPRENDDVARVKADRRMADVIARAVGLYQRVPDEPVVVPFDEHELVLTPGDVAAARGRARRGRQRHNRARYAFARHLLRLLVGRVGEIDPELATQRWVARTLMGADEFRDLVNRLWPRLSAADLVAALLTDAELLSDAGRRLNSTERRLLCRPADSPWTDADVPLLDEAWSLLGDPDEMLHVAAERRRSRADRAYARQVLENTGLGGRVDAATLAARFADSSGRRGSTAERAAADADWEFGHVIVDEAQELSPMAWRMVARRCPNRSMTVVGDIAQASAPWAPTAWREVLDEVSPGRWRLRELTVNYRTPEEVMTVAAAVLAAVDPALEPPESVRSTGEPPRSLRAAPGGLADAVVAAVESLGTGNGGRAAVIVPDDLLSSVTTAVMAGAPGRVAAGAEALDAAVAVLDAVSAKGLEFDDVVVVEPARWVARGPGGMRDLYVALTRATQRVAIVHEEPLPPPVADGLRRVADPTLAGQLAMTGTED